ncbi:MAG: serine--tRNA ligase [Candidatus Sungbacteria bacterium]|uniref:Serine--tRNA ligase n=1 Tax=Candidatus Sungiibacteriota bacterium TaxID=2750080 RepID=A0A932YVP8_9BACT|nr:serine--tRNA ligase [Candidatus Sungbacteria bacterium]
MLDIKFIREYPDKIREGLAKRGVGFDVAHLLEIDEKRRAKIQEVDGLRARQNAVSEEIARLAGGEREVKISEMQTLKARLGDLEFELKAVEEEFAGLMYQMPNLPAEDVPVGPDEHHNKVLREVGEKPRLVFKPKDYIELGEALDLIDTVRAAKVSGSRFGYLKHEAPLLEFAIVQLVFGRLSDAAWLRSVIKNAGLDVPVRPFIPLVPPVLVRPEAFRAMGKLDPGQEEERYYLPKDDLYLVGSAEHSTGPLHMGEVFDGQNLPHRHIAFSASFRREAGSYGKDTRGIMRVHQFDKLEMFSFSHPEHSFAEHDFFLAVQEGLMQELGLPYRVVLNCTGDTVWDGVKQYDIETWLPGSSGGIYRETHSTANSTDFQARRLGTKFRAEDGKTDFVHTVNGTAFAIGRTLIAILENYQQADGSVAVPEALWPYMHGIKEIKR